MTFKVLGSVKDKKMGSTVKAVDVKGPHATRFHLCEMPRTGTATETEDGLLVAEGWGRTQVNRYEDRGGVTDTF